MSTEIRSFIAGRDADVAGWIEREDPARPTETAGRVSTVDRSAAAAAVDAADAAFDEWARRPPEERIALLQEATHRVDAKREHLAEQLTRELGKVISDTRGEISFTSAFVDYCAGQVAEVLQPRVIDDHQGRVEVIPEPFGAVAAITPWNAPIILAMLKVAPALLTGNTIVVKPSPLAPLAVTDLLATLAASLPPGVLNVINGGGEVGAAIIGHPRSRKVAFTGGGSTATSIMRSAAEGVKPLVLELGGNDPAIFLEDATLSGEVMERAVFGSFLTTGQVCMAAKRLYVHASRFDAFVDAYLEAAERVLIIGDPCDEEVTVGPMATSTEVDRVQRLIDDSVERGATAHELGTIRHPELAASGYYLRPTLVVGADPGDDVVVAEQFGPVVPILPFEDEAEVVRLANEDPLGLASSVWSSDEGRALALARQLRCGYTFINSHNRSGLTLRAPFGGFRGSGFGREFGAEGLREYVQPHTVHVPGGVRSGATGQGNAYPVQ